jgi:hypothetical protein
VGGLNTPDLRPDPDNPKPAEKLRPGRWNSCRRRESTDAVSTEPSSKRIRSPERSGLFLSDISVIVYKASLAICGLYALEGNPHLAAICVIIATLQYTRCIRTCCESIARPCLVQFPAWVAPAMRSQTMLALSLICVVGTLVLPMIDRFHENRAREQKKPEKYHLT